MTELNHEIAGELSIDELTQVCGGRSVIDVIVDAYLAAVGKHLPDAIHPPGPRTNMALHMR